MLIQVAIIVLGFLAPWVGAVDLSRRISTLEWLALELSRSGLISFTVAAPAMIVCGAIAALIGAVLRVWGSAYLGHSVVRHGEMQGGMVMAAGPYRYMRNPLYVGGWFMLLALALLMPPSGALFAIVLITIQFTRLILGEEAFLAEKLGEPYRDYLRAVPRIVPRLRSSLPAMPAKPHWLVALGTELLGVGIFFTMAVLSWTYNHRLMIKTVVVVFGISLIMRALIPREQPSEAKTREA